MSFQARIESALSRATGIESTVVDKQHCAGGSINESFLFKLQDGRRFFVKTHARASQFPAMFELEAKALGMLAETKAIHVPRPLAWDEDFIIMEAFSEGRARHDWQELMGQRLAQMHQSSQLTKFGFEADNYLGTSLQPNDWAENWLGFWRDQRLGHQLALFSSQVDDKDKLLQAGRRLLERLDVYLADVTEPAVLLHGDLWSGNAGANENGEPVIFDPASYYGHREAEIGMMRMFGGFTAVCESAYAEVWPLQAGSEERIALYRLYHELNHLNLFGRGYYDSCLTTIRSLL